MKNLIFLMLAFLFVTACDKKSSLDLLPDGTSLIESRTIPTPIPGFQSGDAASECEQAGDCWDFAWKLDAAAPNGTYTIPMPDGMEDMVIVISNSNGISFDWSSNYEVCRVIVKGGPVAQYYGYDEGSCGDAGLVAPINPNNGQTYDISHVTFCFGATPCEEVGTCYQEETAWSAGKRYVNRGNWATYTKYLGTSGQVANIYAGQNMLAGTATFNAVNGMMHISINLSGSFIFYYDIFDPNLDNNIKVQDYSSQPSGNPAPGLFAWKAAAPTGSTSYTIIVPVNTYYGIHLDVAREVPCEE